MILVVNAGSSSLKIGVYTTDLNLVADGMVSNIGTDGQLELNNIKTAVMTADHADALAQMLTALAAAGHPENSFTAAAHRVVHGGTRLTRPVQITPQVLDDIRACIPLAPLHNPVNLTAITALARALPTLPQYASFDTGFHASVPDVANRYAIPAKYHDAGMRRYGFHGMSYANMVTDFGDTLPDRLLALHLGNGASLCAIYKGQSVATSMGYSPLSGLTMGTRAGDIDGAAVLELADQLGGDGADRMLNKNSGLLALAGDNNMKNLLERDDDAATFAVAHFCYWAARHSGSAIVAMGGLDAIAFTGGIGENAAAVRAMITDHLACFGDVPVHVIAADEEKQIARDALALIGTNTL